MTEEQIINEIEEVFINETGRSFDNITRFHFRELIQQAKKEWQKEIAEKIMEYDKGNILYHDLNRFAYEILNK